jgi:hypothetical protein
LLDPLRLKRRDKIRYGPLIRKVFFVVGFLRGGMIVEVLN